MLRFPFSALVATVAAAAGLLASASPLGTLLEFTIGEPLAFRLRGRIPPPTDVVVVTIDQASAAALGLPPSPRDWPRSMHAHLIDALVRRGVTVIVFDVLFGAPGRAEEDAALAASIRDAGNVILLQGLQWRTEMTAGGTSEVAIDRWIDPAPIFSAQAAGLAPFPLPKVPARVDRFWTFTALEESPTLPALSLMIASRDVARQWAALLTSEPELADFKEDSWTGSATSTAMTSLHRVFRREPLLVERLRTNLASTGLPDSIRHRLSALLSLETGDDTRLLNLRGPAGTFKIVRYADLVATTSPAQGVAAERVTGEIAFVGVAELGSVNQLDAYETFFSADDGINVSGVELVASAYADLVEDASLRSPTFGIVLIIVAALSLSIAAGRLLTLLLASILTLICTGVLAEVALADFKLLLPIGSVMATVVPAGFFSGLWRLRREERLARQRLDSAARQYLPADIVSGLSRGPLATAARPKGLTHFGVCIATDIEGFTSIAERLSPDQLTDLLNDYFARLFSVVHSHDGIVTDVVGDGFMCVWSSEKEASIDRGAAVAAALQMRDIVTSFNQEHRSTPLRTRFGLHAGLIRLGAVGGAGRLAATAVGDVATTASRLEQLNKHLGTTILASEEAMRGSEDLIRRPLGPFQLQGKLQSLRVIEILGRAGDNQAAALAANFSRAFDLYEKQNFEEATNAFAAILADHPNDGPTAWFLQRARQLVDAPKAERGVIRMTMK